MTPKPTAGSDPSLERALAELGDLYAELEREIARLKPRCELSGNCCDFPSFGHELFATDLEAEYARRSGAVLATEDPRLCPFWVERRCTARAGRPLACRTFYCDPSYEEAMHELTERHHDRVRQIIARHGLSYRYGLFVRLSREVAALRGSSSA